MSKWDKFWRWFNPPLPDVMQAEMLQNISSNRIRPQKKWYVGYTSETPETCSIVFGKAVFSGDNSAYMRSAWQ